jgi:hypothetical protein
VVIIAVAAAATAAVHASHPLFGLTAVLVLVVPLVGLCRLCGGPLTQGKPDEERSQQARGAGGVLSVCAFSVSLSL